MTDRQSTPSSPRPSWFEPRVAVAGALALASAFFLAAATTLRLRGIEAAGFPANLVGALQDWFGFEPSFMVAALTMVWCSVWFLTGRFDRPVARVVRILGLGFCLAVLVGLRGEGGGGEVGSALAARLVGVVPESVAVFVVALAVIASLLLATDFFFFQAFRRLVERAADGAVQHGEGAERNEIGDLFVARSGTVSEGGEAIASTALQDIDSLGNDGVEAAAVAELESLHLREVAPQPAMREEPAADSDPESVDVDVWTAAAEVEAVEARRAERQSRREARRARRATPVELAAQDLNDADAEVIVPEDEPIIAEADLVVATDVVAVTPATLEPAEPATEFPSVEVAAEDETVGATGTADADDLEARPFDSPEDRDDDETDFDYVLPAVAAAAVEVPRLRLERLSEEIEESEEIGELEASEESVAELVEESAERGERDEQDEPVDSELQDLAISAGEEHATTAADHGAAAAAIEPTTPEHVVAIPSIAPRQGALFGSAASDEDLLREAEGLVLTHRRASVPFLKRRLRIGEDEAREVLEVLARRGVVELEAGGEQARVLSDVREDPEA
ncbi:MAG: DNA translocase FtsK [Planctomycetota bacterium]